MRVSKLIKKLAGNQKVVIMLNNKVLQRGDMRFDDFSYYGEEKVDLVCSNIHDELVIHIKPIKGDF